MFGWLTLVYYSPTNSTLGNMALRLTLPPWPDRKTQNFVLPSELRIIVVRFRCATWHPVKGIGLNVSMPNLFPHSGVSYPLYVSPLSLNHLIGNAFVCWYTNKLALKTVPIVGLIFTITWAIYCQTLLWLPVTALVPTTSLEWIK